VPGKGLFVIKVIPKWLIILLVIAIMVYLWRDFHYYKRPTFNVDLASTEQEAIDSGFIKTDESQAIFHQIGDGNEGNKKYLSPDGKREAVYDSKGKLVQDPVNTGTYNIVPAQTSMAGHFLTDVLPYLIWGNSPEDTPACIKNYYCLKWN